MHRRFVAVQEQGAAVPLRVGQEADQAGARGLDGSDDGGIVGEVERLEVLLRGVPEVELDGMIEEVEPQLSVGGGPFLEDQYPEDFIAVGNLRACPGICADLAADSSRRAALLVRRILTVFSILVPCRPGDSTPISAHIIPGQALTSCTC